VDIAGFPGIVMARFGSEPRFEPEPMPTEPKFSSRFGLQPELNLRSSSRFRQIAICMNLVQTEPNLSRFRVNFIVNLSQM